MNNRQKEMNPLNPKKRRRRIRGGRFLAYLAVVYFAVGAAALLAPLLKQDQKLKDDAEEYDLLARQARRSVLSEEEPILSLTDPWGGDYAPPLTQATAVPAAMPEAVQADRPSVDLAALYAQNQDFVAWLEIPGTNVIHPVVSTDDPDYYLHHTFSGKESAVGTLFSLAATDYHTPSQNIAVYGHHLRSSGEKMFTSLMRYKDPDFYAGHETVYLDTLYRGGTYKIFAVVNMHSGEWNPAQADFSDDAAFLAFVRQAKAQALYDTGVEVNMADELLTLITCDRSYGGKSGRLVVMAVKQ